MLPPFQVGLRLYNLHKTTVFNWKELILLKMPMVIYKCRVAILHHWQAQLLNWLIFSYCKLLTWDQFTTRLNYGEWSCPIPSDVTESPHSYLWVGFFIEMASLINSIHIYYTVNSHYINCCCLYVFYSPELFSSPTSYNIVYFIVLCSSFLLCSSFNQFHLMHILLLTGSIQKCSFGGWVGKTQGKGMYSGGSWVTW